MNRKSIDNANGNGTLMVVGGTFGFFAMCCCFGMLAMLFVRKQSSSSSSSKRKKQKGNKQTAQKTPTQQHIQMTAQNSASSLPPGWSSSIDEGSGYPCYYNSQTGETSWEKPVSTTMANPMQGASHGRNETQLPSGWGKDMDAEGNKFYYSKDGSVQWAKPPGSVGGSGSGSGSFLGDNHVRSETVLPNGWGKDVDGEGNQYYYGENSGDVSWTAPEGSTKNGVAHPDLHL
jgi:hypothetical protein